MTRASDLARLIGAGATINDGTTITTADNSVNLNLVSTDADANSGPELELYRNSASPADNDFVGTLSFQAENDAGEKIEYGVLKTRIVDASDGTEDFRMTFEGKVGGSDLQLLKMDNSNIVFNEDGGDIDFRVEGDTNTHALFVQAGSNGVGIGNDSPNSFGANTDNLVIGTTSGENGMTIASGTANSGRIQFADNTSTPFRGAIEYAHGSSDALFFYCDGNQRMKIDSLGNVTNSTGSYGTISDENLKENISDASSQWNDIKALQVRKYSMKADNLDSADKIGVIAQELEKSEMNGLVEETEWTDPDDILKKDKIKTVKYSILYMKAIKALQEAMTRIETLEAKVAKLESAD